MQDVVINRNGEIMFDELITGDVFLCGGRAYVCLPDIEKSANEYFNAVNLANKETHYFDPDVTVFRASRIVVEY